MIVPRGSSCIDSSDDSSSESGPNKLRCGVGGLADSTELAFIRNGELGCSIKVKSMWLRDATQCTVRRMMCTTGLP